MLIISDAARNGGGRGEEEASDDDNDREYLVGGGNRGDGWLAEYGTTAHSTPGLVFDLFYQQKY